MKNIAKKFFLSSSVATLLLAPYLSVLVDRWSRLELAWGHGDYFALVVLWLAASAVVMCAHTAARRLFPSSESRARIEVLIFTLMLWPALERAWISSFFRTAPAFHLLEQGLHLCLLIALVVTALRSPLKAKAAASGLLLIFSPVIFVFFLQAALFKVIPVSQGSFPMATHRAPGDSTVVWLMFDEWSYDFAFQQRQAIPELQSVAILANQSLVFHRAISPGTETLESVPVMLGQPVLNSMPPGRAFEIRDNVFSHAKTSGWSSIIVGSYLPYVYWFGRDANQILGSPSYKKPMPTFFDLYRTHFALATFAWLSQVNPTIGEQFFEPHLRRVQQARVPFIEREALEAVDHLTANGFLYVHFSLPHDPFLSEEATHLESHSALGYQDNVRLVDQTLGKVIDRLKANGLWENCLFVVTSDHGWRKNPQLDLLSREERRRQLHHVPLLMKLPRQKNRTDVDSDFETASLKDALTLFFQSPANQSLIFSDGRFALKQHHE